MPLEDTTIRKAKPGAKPYKLTDERGLFLLINPIGSKLWRFKYQFGGKERALAFGAYPEIPLKEARARRDDARRMLREGRDPSVEKKARKRQAKLAAENSFESVARKYIKSRARRWSQGHSDYVLGRLEADIFPYLGHCAVSQIEPPELLEVIQKVEAREAYEMAHRIRSFCSQVFRFAIASGICKRDPAADLRGALVPHTPGNMASVPLDELPELLQKIDTCEGPPYCRNRITRIALQLLALTFLRPGELRKGTWNQISWKEKLWTIPPGTMKMRRPHCVPLSSQAIAALEELHEITGYGELLFPGEGPKGLMSENTCLFALYSLGYRAKMTAHGFRAVASTVLNEAGFDRDHVELQLAHVEAKDARRAYNHASWLDQRRTMMAWYALYLDELRKGEFIKPHIFRQAHA